MAGYTAIADVGLSLVELLRDRLGVLDLDLGTGEERIVLGSPRDVADGDPVVLTVFLYRVEENPQMRNADRREVQPTVGPPDPATLGEAPLALDLYYLLTAFSAETATGSESLETASQHRVLGRALQVLRDNTVLRGADLQGSLGEEDVVRISVYPESAEDVLSIWSTFPERPYRPSVSFLVSPVEIESELAAPVSRTVERTLVTEHRRPEPSETEDEEP